MNKTDPNSYLLGMCHVEAESRGPNWFKVRELNQRWRAEILLAFKDVR